MSAALFQDSFSSTNARYPSMLQQQLLCDGITQLHLPVERILLVVFHQLAHGLKRRCADGEQSVLTLDTAMLHLSTGPGHTTPSHIYQIKTHDPSSHSYP